MKRYKVEPDYIGYLIIDTHVEDGHPCNVGGADTLAEADKLCAEWNEKRSDEPVKHLSNEAYDRLHGGY